MGTRNSKVQEAFPKQDMIVEKKIISPYRMIDTIPNFINLNIKYTIMKYLYQVNVNNKDMSVQNRFDNWLYSYNYKYLSIINNKERIIKPTFKVKGNIVIYDHKSRMKMKKSAILFSPSSNFETYNFRLLKDEIRSITRNRFIKLPATCSKLFISKPSKEIPKGMKIYTVCLTEIVDNYCRFEIVE